MGWPREQPSSAKGCVEIFKTWHSTVKTEPQPSVMLLSSVAKLLLISVAHLNKDYWLGPILSYRETKSFDFECLPELEEEEKKSFFIFLFSVV